MNTSFKDLFSQQSEAYAKFRPQPPAEIFHFLEKITPQNRCAWDVGTGNGQAAVELAEFMDAVIATDPSPQQLAHAKPHPRITYLQGQAEKCHLPDNSVDLITASQAVHWFDFDRFYSQVRRVGRKESVIALWTYGLGSLTPALDRIVLEYDEAIRKYWAPERRWVDEKYETLPFPFLPMPAPVFESKESRTIEQWAGYLFSWSATQKAIEAQGEAVFQDLAARLHQAWGEAPARVVTTPFYLKAGLVHGI